MGLRLGSRPTSFFIPRHAYAYNRRTFVESLTATRNGSPLFRQRLEYDRSGQITAQQYEHGNGAQTGQMQTYNTAMESRILRNEEYGYSFRGLMNRASVQTVVDGVIEPLQEWRYRYNAMGEREQKRLYASPGGVVPSPESARYPWVYYLLSGNKQQLAVYHGQHLDSLQIKCGDVGTNRVYLYAHEYLTYGVNDVAMVLTRASGKQEYKVVDHLGSTRVVLDANGEEIGRYDREPFGAAIAVTGVKSRKGFIDKEVDRETKTANHGVRQYDAEAGGTFRSPDAAWESFRGWSTYQYSRNNPVNRLDANGLWDVYVYVARDREKYRFGTAVVMDRKGNVVYTFQVRVEGIGGRDRMRTYADTPNGTYDIDDKNPWISGKSRQSYGPNPRLNLTGVAGEISESKRTDIRIHGGQQEAVNPTTGELEAVKDPKLKKTHGCIRCLDGDAKTLKEVTDELQASDEEEYPGLLFVIPNMVESNGGFKPLRTIGESQPEP